METREKTETAFNRYKTIQEEHLKALEENQADTASLLFERDRAFEDLRNYLSSIPGVSMSDACKRQVSDILKTDKTLANKIKM